MEKELILKAEIREKTGTKDADKMRKSGRIPAIVYGHKQEAVAISLDAHSFMEGLHHGHRLMDVQIGKTKQKILVKALQYDHLGKDVIHVDMMRVDVTEMVKVAVPIEFKGTAKGIHDGGIIEAHIARLEIECRATEIPETIIVSVKDLGVGDVLHVRDIVLPEGVKLVSPPETLLVACRVIIAAKTAEEAEEQAPTAPEVIGEVKEEEKEGEEPSEEEKT